MLADEARHVMAGYLTQRTRNRPHVTLKMAVSADGRIGRRGSGQVAVTGPVARAQVHLLRARSHAILVGVGTVLADDPELTCRLPGLEDRSPIRIVLDSDLRTPVGSRLVRSARRVPLLLATTRPLGDAARSPLEAAGAGFIAAVAADGGIALPELLDDLAARGIHALMVEGGAEVARSFLAEDLVDRIALYTGRASMGEGGVDGSVHERRRAGRLCAEAHDGVWRRHCTKNSREAPDVHRNHHRRRHPRRRHAARPGAAAEDRDRLRSGDDRDRRFDRLLRSVPDGHRQVRPAKATAAGSRWRHGKRRCG